MPGGKFITLPNEVFKVENRKSYKMMELTPPLLLGAFVLFFIDIAIRRFNLSYAEVGRYLAESLKLSSKNKVRQKRIDTRFQKTSQVMTTQFRNTAEQNNLQDKTQNKTQNKEQSKLQNKTQNKLQNKIQNKLQNIEQDKKQPKNKMTTSTLDTTALLKRKNERKYEK